MVGQNIGKYRVLDRIGRGGMGTVYRAIDETLHREVAIKVLNAELNDPEIARRFRAEAITVARLNHPGIATIYELFQHDSQWLMVMEFVRGETLERLVERSGPLPPDRTAELCMQVLAALAHAHSMGVVHRDLKPANIMLGEAGGIKVMDFGIARVAGTEHLTNAGFMMGTPAYMAPEQVLGQEIDARSDLYAIGVVFYRLTAGKLPFKGDTPFAMAQSQVNDVPAPIGALRADLPAWVEPLLARALAKNPSDRFQSAIEFHEALSRSLDGLPMPAPYSSSAPTEIVRTPARAMPTGAIGPRTGTPPNVRPLDMTPSQPIARTPPELDPTVLSPVASRVQTNGASEKIAEVVPSAAPIAMLAPDAAAVAEVPLGAEPVERAAAPLPPLDQIPAPPSRAGSGKLAIAAVAVAIAGGAIAWFVSQSPAPPPQASTSAVPIPPTEPDVPTPPTAIPPPATPLPDASPVPSAAPEAPAGASAGAAVTNPASRSGRASGVTKPVSPELAETPLVFGDVKLFAVRERNKTSDEDVTLRFADGQLTVLERKTGATLNALPYSGILRATYLKARDPKWDPSVAGPPANVDVGGMLRTSKHWLVVQGSASYAILRLEDQNWRRVLDAVTTRTGLTVSLPASTDKP